LQILTTRFTYHQRKKNSVWPLFFKALGVTFFNTSQVIPDKKRVDTFEQYLLEGDELADIAARELFMSKRSHKDSFRLMNEVLENGLTNSTDDIPESFKKLIEQSYLEPHWLNREKLERGAAVCRRLGLDAFSVLGDLALLGGYSNPDLSKPLTFTGALNGDKTFDRVGETSQFWYDVTRPNALMIGNKGFKSAVKVRMMHAIVRQRMLQHPKWDSNAWGFPINKSDALATNVGFSMVMVYGSKMLGYHISNKEVEEVLHLWKYIGYLMGDDVDWLPNTVQEALQSLLLITLANANIPDEGSIKLANDYLSSLKPRSSLKEPIKYSIEYLTFIKHKTYAQYLIPASMHKQLKIPTATFTLPYIAFVQTPFIFVADKIRASIPLLNNLAEQYGAFQQDKVIEIVMGERQASYIPH
jgi:hypothetical protein